MKLYFIYFFISRL